jgi:hypothetical protein
MAICCTQSLEVPRASRVFIAELPTAPSETMLLEVMAKDEICVKPREPAVAIAEVLRPARADQSAP